MSQATPDNTPVLQMAGISKTFPGVRALDHVSLDVRPGEVLALMGENGAGKSTLMKVLAGAHQPDGGEILLFGRPVTLDTPQKAMDLGIGIIYQELNLVPQLSVAENIFLGREPRALPGFVNAGKMQADARHDSARLGRKSRCLSRSLAALARQVKLFVFCHNARQLFVRRFPKLKAHVIDFLPALY